jgi:hypothetical protein
MTNKQFLLGFIVSVGEVNPRVNVGARVAQPLSSKGSSG